MQEARNSTVELASFDGPVVVLLISAMYKTQAPMPLELLLPLFVAADAHQVCAVLLALSKGRLHWP